MQHNYPFLPLRLVPGVLAALVSQNKRSFCKDARVAVSTSGFSLEVLNPQNIPASGPGVVCMNHYSRPGFYAWWIALAISAQIPVEMHWTMTSTWTADGTGWSALKAALSQKLLPALARIYDFTSMPPMPQRPGDAALRATAVRQVLSRFRSQPGMLLGLAPEGRDTPGGALAQPPAGVGRFLSLLARSGCLIYPVGVYENNAALQLSFGAPFRLTINRESSPDQRDRHASDQVMQRIAGLMPTELHGVYAH